LINIVPSITRRRRGNAVSTLKLDVSRSSRTLYLENRLFGTSCWTIMASI